MKNLVAVTGTLIVLLASLSTQARSIHPLTYVLSADIETMDIDQDSYLNEMALYGGVVKVKQIRKELSLELNYAPKCAPNMACIEVLLIHEINLKITNQVTDRCGNTSYIAERDLRPVDGVKEKLVVTDYTNNICPTFVALPATGVLYQTSFYDRINGKEVSTQSSFYADKLEGRVLPTSALEKVLPALK